MSNQGRVKTPATQILLKIIKQLGRSTINFIELGNYIKSHSLMIVGSGFDYAIIKKLEDDKYRKGVLKNLKYSNYIKTEKMAHSLQITLNDKAKTEKLTAKLKQAPPNHKNLQTLVIFDIPQNKKILRDKFRYLLKRGGFKKLQHSVWLSELDTYDLIIDFAKSNKINNWVNVLRVKDTWHE